MRQNPYTITLLKALQVELPVGNMIWRLVVYKTLKNFENGKNSCVFISTLSTDKNLNLNLNLTCLSKETFAKTRLHKNYFIKIILLSLKRLST